MLQGKRGKVQFVTNPKHIQVKEKDSREDT